jgi:ADP-L-glycero-D-manno-heptose 6-epimerase
MEKVILTGSKGFIGSNLKVELEKQFEVIEINEDVFNSSTWKSDVSNLFWLDIKAVFHVGACSNTLEKDVNYMMLVNYEFSKHISNLCNSKKVPLIYSSSAANYGVNNEYPSNLYGWSKYIAEEYIINNGGIALRYFNVYGPGEEHKGIMSSVAYQMYMKKLSEEEIKLFPGNPKRDFIYVKDIVSANMFAFENYKDLLGKFYDVGSGVAESFEKILNVLKINFEYTSRNVIPKGYQFYTCSNKIKWMKGWEPKYTLKEGLTEYLEYLK